MCPQKLWEQCLAQGSEAEIPLHSLALSLTPQSGLKPCRLHLRRGREITLIWNKIHVFIHDSALSPCCWDTGDTHQPKLQPVPVGGQHPCLAEGRASQVLWAEGPDLARASRSRTQGFREELFGTRKVKPPGREQYLESHMRLSLENGRELLLRSFSLLQVEGNGYIVLKC